MSLFSALSVSASGLSAQSMRAEVLAENLANADTTRTAEGGPYRRKDVVFESRSVAENSPFAKVLDESLRAGMTGVGVAEVAVDSRDPIRIYKPGHPDADPNGYVAMPRVNPAEDMVDLMNASSSYQANLAAISAVKHMLEKSIDLIR